MTLQKKVCMIGAFAVGKTSLVQRFVNGIFSDKYLTTVGVKIDKATIETPTAAVSMVLWDLAGEDGFRSFQASYLNGARGLIYVLDQTRRTTLDAVHSLREQIETDLGCVPAVLFVNKSDLASQSELSADDSARLSHDFPHVFRTSARTGEQVEDGFRRLAELMVGAGEAKLVKRS
jgi:small GTP-binding protein